MNNILVTGGLGFIGFNFIQDLVENYPLYYKPVCYDWETYAAQAWIKEKKEWLRNNEVYHELGDIKNFDHVLEICKRHKIDTIVNFAAESHVDRSLNDSLPFIETNIIGTYSLLNVARELGLRFHQIGTDEVYGSVDPEKDYVDEHFETKTSSPYSASKASADLLTISYAKSFGLEATVSRCSNNFGPWQHPEKLIPKTITNALEDKKIPVYGDGKQRRFWIYVKDHNEAVMRILENGKPGEIYNIAPAPENLKTNIDIVKFILDCAEKPETLIEHVTDRPGHDLCYYLEGKKIQEECGFVPRPSEKFYDDLASTVEWYKDARHA